MKGIAEIQIIDAKTGKIKECIENNNLSNLLNNIYKDDLYDGSITRTTDLTNYFKRLLLLKDSISGNNGLLPDECNVLATMTTESEAYEDDEYVGYQFNFEIPSEIEGTIKSIALASSEFVDIENGEYSDSNSSLVYGGRVMYTGLNEYVINVDVENSLIYTLSFDYIPSAKEGSPFFFYLNKYYHNFKEICLFNENFNAQLLESTSFDVSELFEGLETPIFTSSSVISGFFKYSIDENNNNLVITLMPKDRQKIHTYTVNLDDTTKFEVHNMTLPSELTMNMELNYEYVEKLQMIPIHGGRLLFKMKYQDDTVETHAIVGINYLDSTDYVLYTPFLENSSSLPFSRQLLGTKKSDVISEYITIKGNEAFVSGCKTKTGYYYKSKIMNITSDYIDYNLSKYDISTINNLSKAIIKTKAEIIKIKYKIVQEKGAS